MSQDGLISTTLQSQASAHVLHDRMSFFAHHNQPKASPDCIGWPIVKLVFEGMPVPLRLDSLRKRIVLSGNHPRSEADRSPTLRP